MPIRQSAATRRLAPLAISSALILLLAACGSSKETAASNSGNGAVGMRDMEVVDGTTNDSMTDLDAVRQDGAGLNNMAANDAQPTKADAAPDKKK